MATATATGNGATAMIDQSLAMAPGQGHWDNCNSTGTLGQQEQWQWGNGNGATALLSLPLRWIDRVPCVCGRGAWGVGRGRFIPCILIQNVSECQLGVRIKGVTYLFDYFD
jgi:hypothetical protein